MSKGKLPETFIYTPTGCFGILGLCDESGLLCFEAGKLKATIHGPGTIEPGALRAVFANRHDAVRYVTRLALDEIPRPPTPPVCVK